MYESHWCFCANRCGPSRRGVSDAPAGLKNFAHELEATFSTISARNGHVEAVAACQLLGEERTWLKQNLRSVDDPGCVKTPFSNLRVELPSRFRRCGSRLYWQLLSEEGN